MLSRPRLRLVVATVVVALSTILLASGAQALDASTAHSLDAGTADSPQTSMAQLRAVPGDQLTAPAKESLGSGGTLLDGYADIGAGNGHALPPVAAEAGEGAYTPAYRHVGLGRAPPR